MHSFQQPYYEHLTFFLVIFTKLPATEKVLIMSDLFILLFVYVSSNLRQYCQCPGFLSGTEDPGLLLAVWGEPADCTSTQQHTRIRHKVRACVWVWKLWVRLWGMSYRLVTPVLQHLQLPSDHRLHQWQITPVSTSMNTCRDYIWVCRDCFQSNSPPVRWGWCLFHTASRRSLCQKKGRPLKFQLGPQTSLS